MKRSQFSSSAAVSATLAALPGLFSVKADELEGEIPRTVRLSFDPMDKNSVEIY